MDAYAHVIRQNIEQMQTVRVLARKFESLKRSMETSDASVDTGSLRVVPDTDDVAPIVGDPLLATEASSRDARPLVVPGVIYQQSVAAAVLRRVVFLLLQHAGFEAAQRSAIDLLIHIVEGFFLKLGKTLAVYRNDYGRALAPEEILSRSLREMGVNGVRSLETHWRETIVRFGQRLAELKKHLEHSFQALLNEAAVNESNAEFSDDDVAFASGNFGEELGVDFFGFKDIGLEVSQVPTELLFPGKRSRFEGKRRAVEIV